MAWTCTHWCMCVKTVPEAWSRDCKPGAPCCTACLRRYFSDERSQWHGIHKRGRGLWHILPIDHTHFTDLLRSSAYEKRIELRRVLPSGPYSFPKVLFSITCSFSWNHFQYTQVIFQIVRLKHLKVHAHCQKENPLDPFLKPLTADDATNLPV